MVLAVSVLCFSVRDQLNYRVVALILLLTVSVIAMLFDIFPVLLAASLSAVIWNYFFIPPLFTLDISSTEDLLMFLSYFFVALLNAVLTFKIRQAEQKARDKEEKEKTIRLYNTLLNSLSHELRTPIATILGTVDTLKEHSVRMPLHQQMDLLNEIDIAGIRLNRQVENILNMSRLESGMLQPRKRWCDLQELVHNVIGKVAVADKQLVRFVQEEPLPLFLIDIGFMEQVLFNLLHNAVLYTPPGTVITVAARHEDGQCVVVVHDNGKGFEPGEIPLVFDKFYRVPHTQPGGSGLGLSIVKGFAEAQNGSVTLMNHPEGGAEFTLRIPAATTYINNLKHE